MSLLRCGLQRPAVGGFIGLAAWLLSGAAPAPAAAEPAADARHVPPVVAGYHRLKEDAKADPETLGELLLGELNCLLCHAAEGQARVMTKGAPDLADVGNRITPQYLHAYLSDPHAVKPGATMPDLFHASEAEAKKGAVDYLTHYLVSMGGPIGNASVEGNVSLVEQGHALYHSVGCVACHAPEKPPEKGAEAVIPSVPLGNLATKTTVDELAAFLLDPIKVRPGSRMPASNLSADESRAIAVYLLREQLNNPQAPSTQPLRVQGVRYAYYEVQTNSASIEKLGQLKPKSEGRIDHFDLKIPGRREQNFAVKFTGMLHVPKDGHYTFHLKSDDGSRLYLDSKQVIENDGVHAPAEKPGALDLKAGDHPIAVTFFQAGSGAELSLTWSGPGIKRGPVPPEALFSTDGRPMAPLGAEKFAFDPEKAQMGQRMFATIGCAACHTMPHVESLRKAKPLAALATDADTGCLGEHVAKGLPQYELSPDQRQALAAAVRNAKALAQPLDPKAQVVRTLAAMNCYACHRREDAAGPAVGGPHPARAAFFILTGEYDLGEEGRLPPKLSGIGGKLLPRAVEQIVFDNKLHVRPYMATRMPRFSRDKLAALPELLEKIDGPAADAAPKFSEAAARDGRLLVGTKGLGCVNCHGVAGIRSLGMPSIDLSTVHERLRPAWFHTLLVDPASKNPGTRMPQFWPDGKVAFKDAAGGAMDSQIDAIWDYVSLGTSMPLPAGLQPSAGDELTPADEPIVHRTMMAGAGNRSVLVGYPEMVHVAFDADVVRLAKAWRGRFFDAKGMWEGRGGQHLGPLGTDVIDLPPGPAFAFLPSPDAPWPTVHAKERNVGGHYQGYTLDKQDRPVFRYDLDGIEIQEQPIPVLHPGNPALVRRFVLTRAAAAKGDLKSLTFLAASGSKIQSTSPDIWVIDDKLTLRFASEPPAAGGKAPELKPVVRDAGSGVKQLLVPISLENTAESFSVEMSW